MKNNFSITIACGFALSILLSCKQAPTGFDASEVDLEWRFIQNELDGPPNFKASLKLKNNSPSALPASGWKLYFNLRYHGHDLASTPPEFVISHVSGELFTIQPTNSFKGLNSGESIEIEYKGKRRIANYQDIPSGFFWVDDNNDQIAIEITKPVVRKDSASGKLPAVDAAAIYARNALVKDIPADKLPKVFPTPQKYEETNGSFKLDETTQIVTDSFFEKEAEYLAEELGKVLGPKIKIVPSGANEHTILLRKKDLGAEAYQLEVNSGQIIIEANDGAGLFYGIQSLKTSLPPDVWKTKQTSNRSQGYESERWAAFSFSRFYARRSPQLSIERRDTEGS